MLEISGSWPSFSSLKRTWPSSNRSPRSQTELVRWQQLRAESQQIALRDQEANSALVEPREQASGLVAAMRDDFAGARTGFIRLHLMLKHESRQSLESAFESRGTWAERKT